MGALISRFRKSKTTTEILEDIDKNIAHLEKFRRANQELRQKVIGKLILYSVIIYIVGAFSLYFFFLPQEWSYRIYGLLPFFFFPILVYILKRILHWFFVRKISQNEEELQDLRSQRKDILENVMETETYKKAKEILEKFDPETKKKLEQEKKAKEQQQIQAAQTPNLRRRQVSPHQQVATPHPQIAQGRGMPIPNIPANAAHGQSPINSPISRTPTPLPRPILPLNKTALDKIMDYMIGDGSNQRYALICQRCASHNGMALKEEFHYLAFRCAYCTFFNPARKQRPNAPPLPVGTPRHIEQIPSSSGSENEADSGSELQATSTSSLMDASGEKNEDFIDPGKQTIEENEKSIASSADADEQVESNSQSFTSAGEPVVDVNCPPKEASDETALQNS